MALTVTLSAEIYVTGKVLTWTFSGSPSTHSVYRQLNDGIWTWIADVPSPTSPEIYTDPTDSYPNVKFGYYISDTTGIASNIVYLGEYTAAATDTVTCLDSSTTAATTSPYSYTDKVYVSCLDVATTAVDDEVPGDYEDTATDTVTCTDTVITSLITPQNYGYYLGTSNGMVHAYNENELGDNGVAINAYWKSKRLDFSDMYPDILGSWKTISHVQLTYLDKSEATVTLGVSTDGGVSWVNKTKTFGSGTERVAEKSYHFWQTGRFFNFRVSNVSSTETFQLLRLTVHFMPQAEQFATA